MKYLNKEQMDEIKKVGLFTGSRCFNSMVKDNSDYDFVLLKEDAERIVPRLKEKDKAKNKAVQIIPRLINKDKLKGDAKNIWECYHEEQYEDDETIFVSLKFRYETSAGEFLINLIIVDSQVLYDAWKFTTKCFKTNNDLLNEYFPEDHKESYKTKDIKKLFFEDIKLAFVKSHHLLHDKRNPKLDSSRLKGICQA